LLKKSSGLKSKSGVNRSNIVDHAKALRRKGFCYKKGNS
jgi:hypothetical protein